MALKLFFLTVALAFVAGSAAQIYTGVESSESSVTEKPAAVDNDFITQTVYGFLDFTTTIGNTVMVFSPQSAPAEGEKGKENATPDVTPIATKPAEVPKKNLDIQPSKTHKSNSQSETKKNLTKGTKIVVNSVIEPNAVNGPEEILPTKNDNVKTRVEVVTKSPVLSTVVEVRPKDDVPGVKNNLAEPEYDFLSTQPAEVVDETYKLINLRPSSKAHGKPRPSRREKENPTGLVTKLGGTIVKDGLTTVHETSVIGTYINGKYAQVLQSSSRVLDDEVSIPEGKIKPTNSQRILKTIGPHQGKGKVHLEATPTNQPEESAIPLEGLFNGQGSNGRPNRRQSNNHPVRPKFRNKITDDVDNNESVPQPRAVGKNRPTTARPSYKNRPVTTTTEQPTTRRRTGFRPNGQPSSLPKFPNKISKSDQSTSSPLPKLKLPRTQGRWSYKTTPKPRIAIRKQVEDENKPLPTAPSAPSGGLPQQEVTSVSQMTTVSDDQNGPVIQRKIQEGVGYDDELDESESEDVSSISVQEVQATEQIIPAETLNVEISTPAEFNDIYFEIATIKSPYSFQVGSVRNTRFITVTSTIKKTFATSDPVTSISPTEPLTENILANTGAAYETTLPLDSSIATLPAISLESGQATPPLETITETFSTTQTLLKTHLLPVVANGNTTKLTLVQTYNIVRIVTATKTLPPMDIYQFIPSKTLNEFNSKLDEAGSELHLELDFGDDERDDDDIPKRVLAPSSDLDSDLDIFSSRTPSASKPKKDPAPTSSIPEPQLTPDQAQQLALLKLFGQAQPQIITTSRPVVVLETLFESHVIPVVNNGNTVFSTLSRPVGTIPRTSYEFGTSTVSPLLSPPVPQLQQVPQVPQVPLFPHQQQYTVTTAPFVTQTVTTISDSRVLKLTFGAKTAFTTLYSTKVVPTEVTTYVTSTIALQPTVPAFPGYYPPPVGYPPYPFVG